ncbi:hypothetical protein HZS_4862 [Henneguya salminicola]|nr:hypothetical protein HZS_4862 [Henneguya salminicola]
MDNVNFHHMPNLINAPNISLKYIQPHSPFLNPCEEVFSFLKSHAKRDTPPIGTGALINRIKQSCLRMPTINISNHYSTCEKK